MLFEGTPCLTEVLLDCSAVGVYHPHLVHNVFHLALSIKRASVHCAIVTRRVGAKKPGAYLVIVADDAGDVGHTTKLTLSLFLLNILLSFDYSGKFLLIS